MKNLLDTDIHPASTRPRDSVVMKGVENVLMFRDERSVFLCKTVDM